MSGQMSPSHLHMSPPSMVKGLSVTITCLHQVWANVSQSPSLVSTKSGQRSLSHHQVWSNVSQSPSLISTKSDQMSPSHHHLSRPSLIKCLSVTITYLHQVWSYVSQSPSLVSTKSGNHNYQLWNVSVNCYKQLCHEIYWNTYHSQLVQPIKVRWVELNIINCFYST